MRISGLQKLTLIDYPGKLAATIFTPGCNFRCGFCHNPELVIDINPLQNFPTDQILGFLESRTKYLEAVCITGGEPLLQSDLLEFTEKLKKMGYLVKIDTNGTVPDLLQKLIKKRLVDYIAMDIKAPLKWGHYKRVSSMTDKKLFENILESIKILFKLNRSKKISYEFRTTVVPKLLKADDIETIAKQIKGAKKYVLQQFKNSGKMINKKFKKVKPYSVEELELMCQLAKKYVKSCELANV